MLEGLAENFKLIEDTLGVTISSRGDKIFILGEAEAVETARLLINELKSLRKSGHVLKPDDIRYSIKCKTAGEDTTLTDLVQSRIQIIGRKRPIIPKTQNQRDYIKAIKDNDIVLGIGPAGTGKTYLAMAMAVQALLNKEVSRVVLARPAVEAGEKLGFLPGDMIDKVNPYLRPLYDALYDMLDMDRAGRLIEQGIIEIAPLAFMRGRTLNDSFIILDEAQNTTAEQMKMYLTRLGYNSKTVITGDITQVDLPAGKASGLAEAEKILSDIEGIRFVYFSERDVVRHKLVQEIVKAYDKYEKHRSEDSKDTRQA